MSWNCQVPTIGLVIGERGLISRIICAKFSGYLTFGTLESGFVSAPGQPTIKDLLDLYDFRQIGPDTKVFGIIGKPVGHSKSPFLYNEAFKSVGFNGVCAFISGWHCKFSPDLLIHRFCRISVQSSNGSLAEGKRKLCCLYSALFCILPLVSKTIGVANCTIPHKEAAVKCCDEVDPVAKSIGAVNCITRRQKDGKLFGYNTDYVGAISAIEDGLRASQNVSNTVGSPLAGKLFVVIGAGGAGKALAYGAKEKGARVVIANRTYGEVPQYLVEEMPWVFEENHSILSKNRLGYCLLKFLIDSPCSQERAKELAETIGADAVSLADLDNFHPEYGMILANTTSIGMQPKVDETPISKKILLLHIVAQLAPSEIYLNPPFLFAAPEELFKKIMSKNRRWLKANSLHAAGFFSFVAHPILFSSLGEGL
ncbi:hypothetical protein Peur_041842 [Populus x canadensis]